MRKRIKLVLQTKNPDIICDLRANNGFQGTKFDDFWDAMQEYFNDVGKNLYSQILLYYEI
jgi:hypothetical protein